jgi:hypothetical protein
MKTEPKTPRELLNNLISETHHLIKLKSKNRHLTILTTALTNAVNFGYMLGKEETKPKCETD